MLTSGGEPINESISLNESISMNESITMNESISVSESISASEIQESLTSRSRSRSRSRIPEQRTSYSMNSSIIEPDPSLNSIISEISEISLQSTTRNNSNIMNRERSTSQILKSPMITSPSVNHERSSSQILTSQIMSDNSSSQILTSPIMNHEKSSSQILTSPIMNHEKSSSQILTSPIMQSLSPRPIPFSPKPIRQSSYVMAGGMVGGMVRADSLFDGDNIEFNPEEEIDDNDKSNMKHSLIIEEPITQQNMMGGPIRQQNMMGGSGPIRQQNMMGGSGPIRQQNMMGGSGPIRQQNTMGSPIRQQNMMGGPIRQQNMMGGPIRQQNTIGSPISPISPIESIEPIEPIRKQNIIQEPLEPIESIEPIGPVRKQTLIEEPIESIEPVEPMTPMKKQNTNSSILTEKPKINRNSHRQSSSVKISPSVTPSSPASTTHNSTYEKLTSNSRRHNRPHSVMSEASTNTFSKSNRDSRSMKSQSVDFSLTSDGNHSTTSVRRKIFSVLFMPGGSRSSNRNSSRSSNLFSSGASVRSSRLFGGSSSSTFSRPISMDRKRRKKTVFTDLPDNVLQLIFKYIGETYPIEFKHTCRKTYRVGNHPDTIAKWLYYYYDPKVLTIPETDQQIAFKKRVIVTNEVIASIVNNIDENVVEDFDDNLKNSLTSYALKNDDLHLLQALFKPFCFNVEVGLVSVACQNQNRTSQEFIAYLFEKDFILPKSTFYEACNCYNTYVINCYLKYNDITHKDIDDYFKDVDKRPFHPMVAAARSGDMELIQNIIERIGCSVSLFGYYAFIKAISHNKLTVAKYIFNVYPQLDMNDNEMMNIVSKAAERGRLETLRFIKYIYDKRYGKTRTVNVFRKPGNLANAITAAALAGQLECCVWLMERERKYINSEYANRILDCFANHVKGKSDLPLLHRARFLQYMTRFPTNFKRNTGYDLLKTSIIHDDVESMSVLIDQGVNIHVDNEYPLQYACGLGKTKAVQYLLERGAQPNKYVLRTVKKGITLNGNIIRLDRDKKDEVSRLLSLARSSKRFSFRK